MSSKIFVGSIPFCVTGYDLREFFSKFGQVVDALVVRDKRTRKSKGFGFVKFSGEDEAKKALEANQDELTMKTRVLKTAPAGPKKPRDLFGEIKVESPSSTTLPNRKSEDFDDQKHLDSTPNSGAEGPIIKTKFIDLNEDVREVIFSELSLIDLCRMSRVCKQWKALMTSAWSQKITLDFTDFSLTLSDKVLARILTKTQKSLTNLNLGQKSSHLSYFALEMVGELCPNLKQLHISGMVVTKPGLKKFSKSCPNVEVLTAQNCVRFNAKSAWELLHSLHKLQVLDLSDNEHLTGKCFERAPATITSLVLTDCKALLSVGVALAIEHCPALTLLNLTGCTSLDDTVVSSLLLSKLTHLEMIGRYPLINNSAVFSKIGNIKTLEYLNVRFNDMVCDGLLANLSNVEGLTHLGVSGCNGRLQNNDGVTDVGLRKLKNITHLYISYLSGVSDRGLRHLSTFKSLKTVDIRGSPYVTNNGVGALVCRPSLTQLDVSGCRGVTKFNFAPLLVHRSSHAEHLDVILGGTDGTITLGENEDFVDLNFVNVGNVTIHLQRNNCIDMLRPDYVDPAVQNLHMFHLIEIDNADDDDDASWRSGLEDIEDDAGDGDSNEVFLESENGDINELTSDSENYAMEHLYAVQAAIQDAGGIQNYPMEPPHSSDEADADQEDEGEQ